MTTASDRPAASELNGWHVLAGFVVFFGVTIAVDTVMIVDAYRTYPGEAAASPYEEGLAFDSDDRPAGPATGAGLAHDRRPVAKPARSPSR